MGTSRNRGHAGARTAGAWIALAAALTAGPAHAQLGPFHIGNGLNGFGVAYQTTPQPRIWVDANGDGLDNAGDTHHAVPSGVDATWALTLSPSRRVVVATSGSPNDCTNGALRIRVYAVPRSDHALVQLGGEETIRCLLQTHCDDTDTTAAFRTVAFVTVAQSNPGVRKVLWWNLVTGERGMSPADLQTPFGGITFSPSGTMATVMSDLNNTAAGGTLYTMVDLCPATIGQSSGNGFRSIPFRSAEVIQGTPDLVVVHRASGFPDITVPYQTCATSDPTGACCLAIGGCQQTTQSACNGTWQAGVTCASAGCPSAALAVTMAGPGSALRGAPVTYTFSAQNTGTLASNAVTLTDRIPVFSTFVSASAGGSFDAPSQTVTWSLGTLGPGAGTTRTLTVTSHCQATSMINDTYAISGTPGGTVAGTPPVTTTLAAESGVGLAMTCISQRLAPAPLQSGDRVRYTVRIANTGPTARDSLRFSVLTGPAAEIVQLLNAGGGAVVWSAGTLSWKGPVPAGAVLDVVYETRIKDCRGSQPTTEAIHRGFPFSLFNGCSVSLALAFPDSTFAVSPSPVRLSLESPSHGPVQWWGNPDVNRMIACRPGDAVELELRCVNRGTVTGPATTARLTIPAGVDLVTDPPFVGTPPAGTTWDQALRTITWNGALAAMDSVQIRFQLRHIAGECRTSLLASGGFGACPNQFITELSILAVPLPPPAYLLSLHNSSGLRFRDPAGPGAWTDLLCGAFEFSRGFGVMRDETIWVAGQPCFTLNPRTLAFRILPPTFPGALGMSDPFDVAEDPRDSTLVFSGYQAGLGLRLRRYDPRTGAVTAILNDTSPQTLGVGSHVVVGPDGIIGVNNSTSVLRVDPANPPAYQRFFAPGNPTLVGLAHDLDGHWLVTTHPATAGAPRYLLHVSRDDGSTTTVYDFGTIVPWSYRTSGLAPAPDSAVWVGTNGDWFGVLDRTPVPALQPLPETLANVDLAWVGGIPASGDATAASSTSGLWLGPASPNPARGGSRIRFTLPRPGVAAVAVFDSQGRRVRVLADGPLAAGEHVLAWDGADDARRTLPAGLYFVRLGCAGETRHARVVLTR